MAFRAKRWIVPFIALGMMVISSCGQSGKGGKAAPTILLPQIPQTTAIITGQVLGVPEMGISYPDGATVTIVGYPQFTVTTDPAGNFQIAGVPAGSYSIAITAVDNNHQEVNYIRTVMVSGNLVDLGALNIMQTGAITGTVSLEGGGNPLGTLLYIPGTGFSGYADETGYFIILYIPEGTYRLRFERVGYTPIEVTDIIVQRGAAAQIGTVMMNHAAPAFTSAAPTAAGEGAAYTYNITANDQDTSQTLTVTVNSGTDTCNGTLSGSCSEIAPLNGCAYTFTPNATAQSCVVGITVTDSFTPSASINQNTTVTINRAPTITSTAPNFAGQGVPYAYTVTATDPDIPAQALTCAKSAGDTCGGTFAGCVYTFIPGASDQSCVVGVQVSDNGTPVQTAVQNTPVTINRTPTITSTAPTSAGQGVLYSYTVTATDPDVPAQILTCAKSAGDTCGGTFAGCVYTFTPGAAAQSCVAGVQVSDNGTPVETAVQNTSVTINRAPTITSTAPTSASQGTLYSYTVTATDPDIPAQALTCTKSASDTCGGTFAGCVYTFTPGASVQSCVVGITVTDSGIPVLSASQNTTVTINRKPVWSAVPADIKAKTSSCNDGIEFDIDPGNEGVVIGGSSTCRSYNLANGAATDADMPNSAPGDIGFISCAAANNTCSFAVDVTGSGAGAVNCQVSFSPGSIPESCHFDEVVTDGKGLSVSKTVTIDVYDYTGAWYVKADAVGTGDGSSWENAFNNVQDAVDISEAGDQVWVAEGTYYHPYVSGPPQNYALNFDGTDDYTQIPYTADFDVNNAVSIEAWVKIDSCKHVAAIVKLMWGAEDKALEIDAACKVDFHLYSVFWPSWATSSASIPVGVWTHIAGVYDGTAERVYINGTQVASKTGSGDIKDSANPIFIARRDEDDGTHTYLGGVIDEVRWWNVARTQQQIQDNMNKELTGAEAGLVGYWNFNEGSGQVVVDKTNRGNNGVLGDSSAPEVTDPVWVTDTPFGPAPSTESVLVMKDGVEIFGGFAGTESDLSQRGDPASHPTILDGQNTSYHVVKGASSAVLDGFTITRGNASLAWPDPSCYGGGIYGDRITNLVVSKCVITGNKAKYAGGGIEISTTDNSNQFINCTISSNQAQYAGGMHSLGSSSAIINSSFIGNTATSNGGAIYNNGSSSIITGSLFSGNHANSDGGGVYNVWSAAIMTNCLFIGNTSSHDGGGLYNSNTPSPQIINCTIKGNTATAQGGGMKNSASSPAITNTILWGDSAPTGSEIINVSGAAPTVIYSDVQGGYTGTGNINADPKFLSASDLHLGNGSPCIDAGTAAGAPSTDLEGNPRPMMLGYDMGAYEYFNPITTMDCSTPGPNPVAELSLLQCTITTDRGAPRIDPATDTCGGSISGTGPWIYNFTPTEAQGPGSCVASLFSGTGTVNDTVNILEVNIAPSDNAPPTVFGGVDYLSHFDIDPTDSDVPVQMLSCSLESATGECVNGTLSGCVWSWTPTLAQAPTACDVTTKAYDGVAYSSNVTTHVIIYGPNTNPTVTVDCPASADENMPSTCSLTASDVDLPPQGLTCSINATTTCSGAVITGCLSVDLPAQGEAAGPGSCAVVVDVQDDSLPMGHGQGSDTIAINEINTAPYWASAPTDMGITLNQSYNGDNGRALDADLPNTALTDPGNLTCAKTAQTCSFPVAVSSTGGAGQVQCHFVFTAGGSIETCSVSVTVTDGWTPAGTVSGTFNILVHDSVDWTGTSVSAALGGIRPSIARIQNNYPADFGQITMNFDNVITSCSATVTCTSAGNILVTGTPAGNNCRLSANSGYWPSNDTCSVSNPVTAPLCSGASCGNSDSFRTSLRLTECSPKGGMCGGFIDDGTYGTGNSINVEVVNFRTGTPFCGEAATCGTPTNLNHSYVLVEQPNRTPIKRVEKFDADDDGVVTVTGTGGDGLFSDTVKVTAAYKGITGVCDNAFGEYTKCYQFSTFDNVDSRKIRVPLEFTTSADWQLPEAQLWGYIPIEGFSKYVGPRPPGATFPNPLRAAFVTMGQLDQSMSSINLNDLLRYTGDLSTIGLCFQNLGANIGNLRLPGNLILPDLIRQQWNTSCSSNIKISPANTSFRLFTNRPNIQRKIIGLGASINISLFNLYKGLNVVEMPITITAIATQSVNIPALPYKINMGESGGNWTQGSKTPHSVPFEFDFRQAGSFATAKGRKVQFNQANFAYDQERVRLGTSVTPNYGDPNRGEAAAHSGQLYCLGESLLILGVRTGQSGTIPLQLKAAPSIDDNLFTVFQRMNVYSKAFQDVKPWGSGGTTRVVSSSMLGLPSTTSDSDIDWAGAQPYLVGVTNRGALEPTVTGSPTGLPKTVPGNTVNTIPTDILENIQNTTQSVSSWLPLPEVTDPSHDKYYIPPQTDVRGWPINRNGQLLRGTATSANPIHKMTSGNAIGARYMTLRNPSLNTITRYADMYMVTLIEPGRTHIANNYMDPIRGYPDNKLWKLCGAVAGQTSLTITFPYIMPRRAQISGANGIVPDPFEAGNLTNRALEWELAEVILDSGSRGINQAFLYQNLNVLWWYEKTLYFSEEKHQFWWQ